MDKLKNGLTNEQVEKAKELFKQVKLSAICREVGVKYSVIYNVLRDTNNSIADLEKVVTAAQSHIDRNKKALETLPL